MYGPNGPPHHGFARISRWQLEKVGYPNVIESFKATISVFYRQIDRIVAQDKDNNNLKEQIQQQKRL